MGINRIDEWNRRYWGISWGIKWIRWEYVLDIRVWCFVFYSKRRVTGEYIKWRGLEEDRNDDKNINIDWVKVYEGSDWNEDEMKIVIWWRIV